MFYQPGVRIQRPKGYRTKQGFQVVFIVAFCIWVLYQIKHSHDKKKNYGGIPENLHTLKHTSNVLGRKGYVASKNLEAMNSAVTVSRRSEDAIDEQKENVKATVADSWIIEEVEARNSYKEEADAKEIADNMIQQSNETNSSLVDKQHELGHGITGFPDENGIPQDDHELVRFSQNETIWDDNTANDQAILRSHSHRWEKNDKVAVEIISEEHNASKAEITTMLIRKTITTADDGTSLDSGIMSDKSGANTMTEISEKNCVVVKVSNYTSRALGRITKELQN
ncbi:hypothetical protein FRX31_015301 [Thalictrum thalictroides]|uniref:Transmembrane protein n=1 Tax=Thalictrum thalictroides TaxID=46969 RepID=A0A7J6WDQ7_THATH|nr:hypothetical protein FRX31_015301 [Thalictrum thalictroides]